MKKLFKQTGIAISLALMATGFATAQEAGTVAPEKKELTPVEKTALAVEEKAKEADARAEAEAKLNSTEKVKPEVKEAPKPVKKVVRKKPAPKEINMRSNGNYVMPLQNVSTDENDQIVEGSIVHGLHVTPIVSMPGLKDSEQSYYAPLDLTVAFQFKDMNGDTAPDNALVSKSGKNLDVFHFTSNFSKFEAASINADKDVYSSTHSRNQCDIIIYQYQEVGNNEKVTEKFFINKGRVNEQQSKRGCKKDDTNKKETSKIDENYNVLTVTFNKPSAVEGKKQDFIFMAMKDGKPAQITDITTYVVGDDFNSISAFDGEAKNNDSSKIYFNDLNLKAGDHTFVIKYTINGKDGKMIFPKVVVQPTGNK